MNYEKLSDEALVELAQGKDAVATTTIIGRYKNFVRAIIRRKNLFLPDGDGEDLLQEGMIGLIKAVGTFNGGAQFKSYAYTCITSGLISAIEKSNCGKNRALNYSVSFSGLDGGDLGIETSNKNEINPETQYILKESSAELKTSLEKVLSKLENHILSLYLEGYSYEEIGRKTEKNVKAIDNALQRIRAKTRTLIEQ